MSLVVWIHDAYAPTLELCGALVQELDAEGLRALLIDPDVGDAPPDATLRNAEVQAVAGAIALVSAPFPGSARLSPMEISHVVISTVEPQDADDARVAVTLTSSPIEFGACMNALRGPLKRLLGDAYSDGERAEVEKRLSDLGYL